MYIKALEVIEPNMFAIKLAYIASYATDFVIRELWPINKITTILRSLLLTSSLEFIHIGESVINLSDRLLVLE